MADSIKFSGYKILNTGVTLAAGTTSSSAALPATGNGSDSNPRFVRALPDATCYIKFGVAGVTATLNDVLMQPNVAEVFSVRGCTNFAAITRSGTANVNVTPIEI